MKTVIKSCEKCLEEFSDQLVDLTDYARRAKNGKLTEPQSRELLKHFEETHELALKVITHYFKQIGKGPFSGSRDLTVEAFHAELIDDGKAWLDIVIDRIQYNPVYEIDTQEKFLENIQKHYIRLLQRFEETMEKKLNE
ncbi:nucleotidyltransferase substrate binding protein [Algoriphagus antarcticus]|uniref:Nucleotidyltransferase substrate binding protein (TIGR01987 family) n=1 Tax=Algoriphagus antarcticus TaxID=238540 RepID=A0A3E0DRI9_9BACT|nr:nucleotidyltransferase substrate binding protein [Algoriphagus antarcticus]REG84481.1 nucleotidyltransferase substrate binding protein (TIGR01987 family) [Algoriphagus antarcticus]